jgi:hypothetical protein
MVKENKVNRPKCKSDLFPGMLTSILSKKQEFLSIQTRISSP